MRILHVVTRMLRGGTERNVEHFVQVQRGAGHEVDLLTGRDSVAPPGHTMVILPTLVRRPHPLHDVQAILAMERLIRKGGYDVVHTHQSKAGVIGRIAARRAGVLTVHTVHMASFGPSYGRSSRIYLTAERRCAAFTDRLVTVGEELRASYLASGIGRPEQYSVIRSPIDIDAFLDARRRRDGRHPEGPSTALVAGALEDRKRHVLVVERLEPLLRAGRVRLLVAGEGHGRRILEELLARRGIGDCVDLLGHVDDFAAVVARSDVLVHASTAEGVPQVVLQALAVGVPVVATQAEGLHEVAGASVTVVGRSGSDLAAAVEAVLADPPPPVSPDALDPWRPENVAAEIIALTLGLERR